MDSDFLGPDYQPKDIIKVSLISTTFNKFSVETTLNYKLTFI